MSSMTNMVRWAIQADAVHRALKRNTGSQEWEMSSENTVKGIYAGVDVGSLATKSVIIRDGEIAGHAIIPSGHNSEESGLTALAQALPTPGWNGRRSPNRLHRLWAHYRELRDQDGDRDHLSREGGELLFPTCAPSSIRRAGLQGDPRRSRRNGRGFRHERQMRGRHRAVPRGDGSVFKVPLAQLGELSLEAEAIVPMSSTCTVFVESETISLLARGEKPKNIQAGIHHSIALRIAGLFSRVGIRSDVYFSGGVAKNRGMRKALEEVPESYNRRAGVRPAVDRCARCGRSCRGDRCQGAETRARSGRGPVTAPVRCGCRTPTVVGAGGIVPDRGGRCIVQGRSGGEWRRQRQDDIPAQLPGIRRSHPIGGRLW